MTNWLEVSLTVNGELAEAVADVLGRFAPNGVVTEQGVAFLNEEDEGTPTGSITVRAYLPADEDLEETRRKAGRSALLLRSRIQPLPAPTYTFIHDQNWMEAWKARYQPIPIGQRLMILPAWMELEDPARLAIRIDPGMAFGTGTHPSTQLCLELLETVFTPESAPRTVIDVGCGSGILSIAALRLGAEFALGVDIDPAAIVNSRENAERNGLPEQAFALGTGSVEDIRAGRFPIVSAPLVLANILAPVLVRLFEAGLARPGDAGRRAHPGRHPRPSGREVLAAAEKHGLRLAERRQMHDWVALLCRK